MPTLREIQRAIARSILARDDTEAVRHVVDDAIAAADRLCVYRNNATAALVGALRLSYPATEKLVGSEFFEGAARVFIDRHPPRTAYLNDYGDELGSFLAAFPPAASLPYLPDVARLEWAVSSSLNAPDAPALDPASLASLREADHGRVRFVPHPSLRLLRGLYPADEIWRAVLDDDEVALAGVELTVEPLWLLVHRRSESVVVRRLTGEEAQFTSVLCSGGLLAEAMPEQESPTLVALLADHLATGRFSRFDLGDAGAGSRGAPGSGEAP